MALEKTTFPASQSYQNYTNTEDVSTFGGENDTFGADLTAEILKSPDFQIEFDASDLGGNRVLVDSIEVEVFYGESVEPNPEDAETPLFGGAGALGQRWSACAIGHGPTYGQRIIIVGGEGLIVVSDDRGQTWQERESGVVDRLWKVVFTGSEFVAVGNGGVVITSPDGEVWTPQETGTSDNLYAVAKSYGGSLAREGASVVIGTHVGGVLSRAVNRGVEWLAGAINS